MLNRTKSEKDQARRQGSMGQLRSYLKLVSPSPIGKEGRGGGSNHLWRKVSRDKEANVGGADEMRLHQDKDHPNDKLTKN